MKKLPKTLYVKIEPDKDCDGYFVADANAYGLASPGETIKIGTYKLVEVNEAKMMVDLRKSK
jgi:hypothetical protein